jgi:hypothetical protein
MAEVVFLDPGSRELYVDWLAKARAVVGNLRIVAGQFPDDPVLSSAGRHPVDVQSLVRPDVGRTSNPAL